jgi:cytochrome d ubiquinol oxidase subunit I
VLSGAFSGIIVLATVSWMQSPAGFTIAADGTPTNVDPWRAILNPAYGRLVTPSTLAVYQAVGFAVSGLYAWALLRNRPPSRVRYPRLGIVLGMLIAVPTALAQPLVGDLLARRLATEQPVKLAAMEGQFVTERGAPLRIGGLPDVEAQVTRWAIEIPGGLSFLVTGDPAGEVRGLADVPRDQWPPVRVVHVAFQVMVAAGLACLAVAGWFLLSWVRDRRKRSSWSPSKPLLVALVAASPLGFAALEAGWIVTEVGRQPWIIYGVMRTAEAVTPIPTVWLSLLGFGALYLGLVAALLVILPRLARAHDPAAGGAD